jgi:hypothetical protein
VYFLDFPKLEPPKSQIFWKMEVWPMILAQNHVEDSVGESGPLQFLFLHG